jgi:hypothetical protein
LNELLRLVSHVGRELQVPRDSIIRESSPDWLTVGAPVGCART